MDEETLARATEPFFTTKGVGRGTGLGLSMVHGLAEQLSGRLRIRSRIGEGTTVELLLPVVEGVPARPTEQPRAMKEEARPVEARALSVLAVDDDVLVLMNTTAMLEEFGHKVIEASNGDEALAMLNKHPEIDVVVTDYAMPRMNGRDLAAAVAQKRPGVPVILATGYAELPSGDELDVVRLPKPFGQGELKRALSQALQRAKALQ
jgi:CheY-like chemotaxis protein